MRDLSARLREIVRRETPGRAPATDLPGLLPQGGPAPDDRTPTGLRELTYVPEPDGGMVLGDGLTRLEAIAERLGGTCLGGSGHCVVIDRRYPADRSHGRRRIAACQPSATAPLHLFDSRIDATADWRRRLVFFDTETTGLSGGAGTLAFLVGCGWFEDDGFVVRQFFLSGPAGERPMLEALGELFDDASLLVTFNGRTFDVPLMETRWAFHRTPAATDDLPHFDMLPAARRLWGRRDAPESEGCSLSALERRVLGVHRVDDVPGFEVPARYFHFLRSGDAQVIEGVLEHNRYDLVSLAAVMAHALWLVEEGPDACRDPAEQVAIGRIYERAGEEARALTCYDGVLASAMADAEVRRSALGQKAVLLARAGRHVDAAAAWQGILDLIPRGRRSLSPLERRAVEALAIHSEHRARDLASARRYAQTLRAHVTGRASAHAGKRLQRIERKLGAGGAQAAEGQLRYDADDRDSS